MKIHLGAAMRRMGALTLADLAWMAEALQLGNGWHFRPLKILFNSIGQ